MLEFSLVKCHIIKAFDKLKTDSIQIDLKQIKSCEDHKIHFAEVLKAISCYSILLLVV